MGIEWLLNISIVHWSQRSKKKIIFPQQVLVGFWYDSPHNVEVQVMQNLKRVFFLGCALTIGACASGGSSGSMGDGSGGEPVIPEGTDNMVPLSHLSGPDGVAFGALHVKNGIAYACTGNNGMQVSTANSAGELKLKEAKAEFEMSMGCRDVTSAPDGTVFVSGQKTEGGSWIGALKGVPSNGAAKLSGVVTVEGAIVEEMVATKTHLFAALGDKGLKIYGRNDGQLAEVGSISAGLNTAMGVAFWKENQIVIANGLDGLVIVDYSDPSAPVITDTHGVYGTARRVKVVGDLAYVASVNVGVGTYDLNSKNAKPRIASWPTHGSSLALDVSDDGYLYVANWEDLVVFDISDPYALDFLGSDSLKTTDGSSPHVVDVSAAGNVVFVAEWTSIWGYIYVDGRTAPDIRLSKASLNFGFVKSNYKGKGLLVDNLGTEDLVISSIASNNPEFEIDPLELTVKAGDTGFIEVKFTVVNPEEESKGTMSLVTNDPDEGNVDIPLYANIFDGVQVGGPFKQDPDLVYTELKTGNEITVKQKHHGSVVLLAYYATW
ncbi:MAG TPA: hypothetical protein EYN66_00875 [Myxococcales bacterium]|nr:hypothetical protein [Myxococcales bacterium]